MGERGENAPLGRRTPRGLVALTPGTLERSAASGVGQALDAMDRAVAAAIEGGVHSIMVREPLLEDGAVFELASRIRARLDALPSGSGWLAVHDRVHLAHGSGADAVHLGGTSLSAGAARSVVGSSVAIGVSTHEGDDGREPEADFFLHAPVFEPTSKPLYGRDVLGWDGVEAFAEACDRPVLALGGITANRLRERFGGAAPNPSRLAGVALIGGLWGAGHAPSHVAQSAVELTGLTSRWAASEREVAP
jgi:thiamine-phosphate pyrophosphorylase